MHEKRRGANDERQKRARRDNNAGSRLGRGRGGPPGTGCAAVRGKNRKQMRDSGNIRRVAHNRKGGRAVNCPGDAPEAPCRVKAVRTQGNA